MFWLELSSVSVKIIPEQHIFMTRVEFIALDLCPGLSAWPIPQSVLVMHVAASPVRMSKALRKWLWNLISAAFGVLVSTIGSKPVLSSTTPPVIILYSSPSSSSSSCTVVELDEFELFELLLVVVGLVLFSISEIVTLGWSDGFEVKD